MAMVLSGTSNVTVILNTQRAQTPRRIPFLQSKGFFVLLRMTIEICQ